jgi:phosphoglycerate dehydrogenase-like enzyme
MVRPLFTRVLVYDPLFTKGSDPDRLVEFVSFDQLLAESDCVSIHVPLTAETDRLFNRETIARMKKGAYLINCARGPIVDDAALAEAVREHHLAGAGLDVLSQEPMSVDHPFRGLPSVIITPHAAWYSTQAEYRLHAVPAQNILRFFAGEPIPLLNRPTRPKKGSTPQYGDVST